MHIDLGCGRFKKQGYFGIDRQLLPGVDLVCDCNERIPLDDNVADGINATDFLEHINNDKRIHIMSEIWRLLKPDGMLTSMTPSTDGREAFQDPTHFSFWNENSFYYYTCDEHRKLYAIAPKFAIISLKTFITNEFKKISHVEAILKAIKPYPVGGSDV
jgi:SAM-dependent methyltransferase